MNDMERCKDCGKLALVGDTITITVSEYEALKKLAAESKARSSISAYRTASRSAIARNPELAEFILEASVTMTTSEVVIRAKEKFGDAVPSRSSVYRFLEIMTGRR